MLGINAHAAYAQDKGQFKPYNNAISMLKKQQFEQAIPLLQQAISADPVPGANKRVEASLTQDYYPQFYLFYCYIKLKQYDKARPFANAPRPGKPEISDFQTAKSEYDQAQGQAIAAAAGLNKFNDAFGKAEAALAAKKYDEAIAGYTEAKGISADEFGKRGGDGRLTTARNEKSAVDKANADKIAADKLAADKLAADKLAADLKNEVTTLMTRGNTALAARRYQEAITAFNDARTKSAAEFTAQGGPGKLLQATNEQKAANDLSDFENYWNAGEKALGAKQYAEAQVAYNNASQKLPEEFKKRQGQKKLDQVVAGMKTMDDATRKTAEFKAAADGALAAFSAKKWPDAVKQLEAARAKSPDEFRKQSLQAKLDEANRHVAEDAKGPAPPTPGPSGNAVDFEKTARDGLTALFAGDLKTAEQSLSLAHTAAKASPAQKALAHAYLGVVYAEIALQSKGDVKAKNENRAKEEYRQAGNFSFPKKIISPAVLNMLSAKGSN